MKIAKWTAVLTFITWLTLVMSTGMSAAGTPTHSGPSGPDGKPVHAVTQWGMGTSAKAMTHGQEKSGVKPMFGNFPCVGSFGTPEMTKTDGGQESLFWLTYFECSPAALVTIQARIFKCFREGGPDDLECSLPVSGRTGALTGGSTPYLSSHVQPIYPHAVYTNYLLEAQQLSWNGTPYPNAESSIVLEPCSS